MDYSVLFFVNGFIKKLPEWVTETIKKPEFEIRSGAGFDEEEKGVFPLIDQDKKTGRQRLRIYQKDERIKPLSLKAEKALNYITEAFKDVEKTDDYIADGYFHSVSNAVNDTDNFSVKDAASILRKAMLESNGCK